jgi:hypothetical protein
LIRRSSIVSGEPRVRVGVEVGVEHRQAERQVELIGGALAHARDADAARAVAADADQHAAAPVVELRVEPPERAAGQPGEEGAGAGEDRALILLAVARR